MSTCNKKTYLDYTPEQLYELVNDIPSYPHFVPYCTQGQVLEIHDWGVIASLTFGSFGLSTTLVTKNKLITNKSVHMTLVKGPLSDLDGLWQFTPTHEGTLISLDITYHHGISLVDKLSGPILDKIIQTMETVFIQEAHRRYGK
jgi:ribosome-associated toxin RatA of RatAB toxin-antitoxin module